LLPGTKVGPMLGNMGPRKEWIWENIHPLYSKINNALQEKKYNKKNAGDFFLLSLKFFLQ
jgi:hypothetical protein